MALTRLTSVGRISSSFIRVGPRALHRSAATREKAFVHHVYGESSNGNQRRHHRPRSRPAVHRRPRRLPGGGLDWCQHSRSRDRFSDVGRPDVRSHGWLPSLLLPQSVSNDTCVPVRACLVGNGRGAEGAVVVGWTSSESPSLLRYGGRCPPARRQRGLLGACWVDHESKEPAYQGRVGAGPRQISRACLAGQEPLRRARRLGWRYTCSASGWRRPTPRLGSTGWQLVVVALFCSTRSSTT